jgi:hypothetical protein
MLPSSSRLATSGTLRNPVAALSFFLFCLGLLFMSCEDETDDFTSGNLYPVNPQTGEPVTPQDTSTQTGGGTTTCWKAPISISLATDFNQLFTRFGGGWTGGDATYSVPLPDGNTLWLFGDSFMGTVNPNRSRPPSAFHRNAFVLQSGSTLTTLQGGSNAYLSPPEPGWWYWPGHGIAYGDTLQVMMFGFKSTGGGAWDFAYASLDVATFKLPDFQLLSMERKMENPAVNFGACVLEDDGYLYLYGSEKSGFLKHLHVARVAGRDMAGDWEYYDGSGWTTDPAASARIFNNVSDQFTVFKRDNRYFLLTQHHILGGEIYLYDSNSPTSAFGNKQLLYCTPQSNQPNLLTYNAFAHLHLSDADTLLLSYNVNSSVFADLFANADNYRPYFVRVSGAF